jgi:hypothetical protein
MSNLSIESLTRMLDVNATKRMRKKHFASFVGKIDALHPVLATVLKKQYGHLRTLVLRNHAGKSAFSASHTFHGRSRIVFVGLHQVRRAKASLDSGGKEL